MEKRYLILSMLLVLCFPLVAQTVSGKITDSASGSPLPGVSVLVKSTTIGTTTDGDGKYTIQADASSVLVISFIGFTSQEIQIGNRTTIDVALVEDITQLGEVVVTAIGIEREKKALGYSVSEVDGEDLNTIKDRNFASSLVGRVPGLVATQSTSGVGGSTRIVIRGNKSIGGNNQPLIVVDGVPVDNSAFGSTGGDETGEYARADYGSGLSDINPDDIESVTVLKGPNAAALYGSRAANGVIMVTTKKGTTRSGIGVSYSGTYTFDKPLILPELQNTYGQGNNGSVPADLSTLKGNGSWGPVMDGSQKLYWTGETKAYSAQEDNIKDFFETGATAINTIALDGGNEVANARFSYTNNHTKGILPNSSLDKQNFNLRTTLKLSDKLSFDGKATYFFQTAENRAVQGTEGIIANLYSIPRNVVLDDLKDFQNEDDFSVRSPQNGGAGNPYWVLNHDVNKDTRNRFLGFAKATYAFTPSLSAFIRVGTDDVRQKIETVNQPGHWYYATGRFNYSENNVSETNADFLLMFNKKVSSDFHLDVNVGGNHRYNTYQAQSIYGENFKIPTKATVASAQTLIPSYDFLQEKKVNSLYGSAQLSFKDILYLDVSARNDWSSALPASNRSYFYPSASASFLVNEFIDPGQSVLDFLKIRAGWAQVGNDTNPYQLTNSYNLVQNGYLGLTTLTRPEILYDEDLKPERISTYEIGTEFKALSNRIYGDFSIYNIKSEDLIWNVPIDGGTGYTLYHTNVGKMTNKGFEVSLGGTAIKQTDFSWDINLNFAKNTNSLDEIIGDLTSIPLSTTNNSIIGVQGTVGAGYGDLYGFDYLREGGKIVVNSSGIPQTTNEKVFLGNYQPDWTAGFSNTLSYKGISLRALIDVRYGGQVYSGTDAALDGSGSSIQTLQYRGEDVVLDAVENTGTPENPVYVQNTHSITGQQYWQSYSGVASNYVFDQTNVRLREVTIMYQIPFSVLPTFIKGASFGIIGRNLAFLYKDINNFDPESSYSSSNTAQGVLFYNVPTTRSVGFSLNVKF